MVSRITLCLGLAVCLLLICESVNARQIYGDLETAGSEKSSSWKHGGGKKHHEEHKKGGGEKGEKGYKSGHESDHGKKGHHDKEGHKKHYEEEGGHKKKVKIEPDLIIWFNSNFIGIIAP